NMDEQKRHVTEMLMDRGRNLVHSTEASMRSILVLHPDKQRSDFFLQKLIIETAQAPDIDYIIIADSSGQVIADSEPSLVGEFYGKDLSIGEKATPNFKWRRVPNKNGADTFEVFGTFAPLNSQNYANKKFVIFIGLNMETYEIARNKDAKETIKKSVVAFVTGVCALFLIGMIVHVRTTRRSLNHLQILSEGIAANMPIGLLVLNNECSIVASNTMGVKMIEMMQKSKQQRNLPVEISSIIDALTAKKSIIKTQTEYTPNGKSVVLEITATRYDDHAIKTAGYIILLNDLSEIKALERKLAHSERLALLGTLSAGVAHEIRNPLSSIKGFAIYFRDKYQDDEENKKIADIMCQEIERLNRVITEMLDFARLEKLKEERCDINNIIKHTLNLVEERLFEKNITISCHYEENIPTLFADMDKLKQAFLNLTLNAVEASNNDGMITVTTSVTGKRVRVDFADTGIGITEETIKNIFEPYYTTKHSGSGLGLAITRRIIEAHNGEIVVTSSVTNGTVFSVFLPMERESE
ncbi:MAG: ATP-binding protein, partial [Deltaproteobacteria bacterium]